MPSFNIQISVAAGQAKIQRLLSVVDARTVLDMVGGRLLSYVDESFRTRGRGQWKPLSPLTLLFRRLGSDMPLQDRGHYKAAFVSERGGPGKDYSTDNRTYVEIGSNLKTPEGGHSLARIHEYGTTITVKRARVLARKLPEVGPGGKARWVVFGRSVTIPARPVLPTKAVAERLIQETVDGMLATKLSGGT